MKNIVCTCIALMCFASTTSAQKNNGFTIKGALKNLNDGEKVSLLYRGANYSAPDTIATAIAKNNRFELKGILKTPELLYLAAGKRKVQGLMFVDNASIEIKGTVDSMRQVIVIGSKASDEYVAFNKILLPFQFQETNLNRQYAKAKQDNDEQAMNRIDDELNAIELNKSKAIIQICNANIGSVICPYLILNTIYSPDPSVYQPLYERFLPEVKQSKYGQLLKAKLDLLATVAVGKLAPNFEAKTPEGSTLSLKDVMAKGKLTLIDFWASWCGPCRKENPGLVKAYEKYHSIGLNIIGFSLDKKSGLEAWKKAIIDDKLTWFHVSDLNQWESGAVKLYGISAIPQSVLIDSKGKIVGKNLKGEELNKKLEELLVK
jgi:thiol-disulfide isomerase/thioredoxin